MNFESQIDIVDLLFADLKKTWGFAKEFSHASNNYCHKDFSETPF